MKKEPLLKRIRESRLFWPLVALALIFLFDAIFAPHFFKIGILNGHLYGNLIDVLNDGAPLMLVAIGMTLVIATGGVDLSVGAVIAISAAMGAVLINPALGNKLITNDILTRDATNTPLADHRHCLPRRGHAVRPVERAAGFAGQHPADGRHADPDGRRPRHRPVDHQRADHDHLLHALFLVRQRLYPGAAGLHLHRGSGL